MILCFINTTAKAQSVTINTPNTDPATFTFGTTTLSVTSTTNGGGFYTMSKPVYTLPPLTSQTAGAGATNPASFTISGLAVGTYTLTATSNYSFAGTTYGNVTDNNTIRIIPTTPTAPATSTCLGSTANITVSGSAPTGGTYALYTAATGGTALSSTTGSTLTTPVITATITYYVGYTAGSPTALESTRRAVIVTANSAPTAPVITAPATVATGVNAAVSAPAPPAGTTYAWSTNGGTPATSTANSFNVQWASGGVKTITCTATNANGCSATSTKNILVNQAIVPTNYAFSQAITLNTNLTGISTTLSYFPALVYIKEDALKTNAAACANNVQFPTGGTNGYDFAFTTSAGTTELFYQVESFDPTTGTLLAWVQVPSVTNAATSLKFYFGSSTPNHVAGFDEGTWTSDYQAVYHFSDAPSASVTESTANAITTSAINMTAANLVAGKIGNAYNFNGTNQYLIGPPVTITSPFTVSAWVNLSALNFDQKIITNQGTSAGASGGYKLGVYNNNIPESEGGGQINRGSAPTPITVTTNTWYYLQSVFTGTTLSTYVNGARYANLATTTNPYSTDPLLIGVGEGGILFWHGSIDEPRVINVAKSDDWIKAEYYNQNNYLTFTTSTAAITVNSAPALAIGGSLPYTWTGTGGTATTTAGSWTMPTSGNPTSTVAPATDGTSSFIIPNTANKPSLSANAAIYGLTIASGTSLSLNSNTLTVGCNIYNSGTINTASTSNVSNIIWNGTFTPQLYVGNNTVGTAQFGNMTVNNTAASGQVKITGGPIDLYNTLTLTSGSLVVDNAGSGALTLKSSGTVTARVDEITSTSRTITGNVTVERWFTGGALSNRGWRLMSSPVNNTATVPASASAMYNFSSLKTNLNITGSGTNFDASANNGPTILFYNTATKLFTWPSDPTTTNRNIGSGFYFYFRGSRTGANKLVKSGGVYPTPEVNVVGPQTGALNQHSFSYTLSNANAGFNQVGNPYPSSISMMSGSGSGAGTPYIGTTGFVYTYVSNANSITAQPTAVTIASGQGFFVKSNSATSSISFTESLKTAAQPTGAGLLLGKPVGTQTPMISLKMVQDSANYDVAFVRFLDTYKKEYDEIEDADDLNGQGQNVFFGALTDDNHLVAIASKPIEKQKTSVFLSVNDNFSGLYSIEKTDLSGIPDVYDVWLMDHFKSDSLDLRANSIYKFNLDKTNPKTFGNSRFEVVIRKKNLQPYQLISFKGQRTGTDVLLKWNTVNEYDYTSFELQKSTDGKNFEAVRNMRSSSQGTYTFKDIYNDKTTTDIYYRLKQTDINDVVSYSDIIIISTQGNGSFSIFPNPATNVIQYRLKDEIKGSVRLRIINVTGITVKSGTFSTSTGQQDISSLTPGSYTIEITDLASKKLILTGKFIKL